MSFFDDLSPLGKILCGAALVAAAPVAAAAAIPVCAAIGTVGVGLGASSAAVVTASVTAVGAVETAAATVGTAMGGVGVAEAVKDGVDLMGYTPWGCIDCVSFTTGQYSKRYGFIYVNKHDDGTGDMSRSRKKSFEWYKTVIASNGETL